MVAYIDRFEAAGCKLSEKGAEPNFIFAGNGLSHAAAMNAFARFAEDNDISLRGIVFDAAATREAPTFNEIDIPTLDWDSCVLVHADGDTRSDLLRRVTVEAADLKKTLARRKRNGHSRERHEAVRDAFYLIFPATGAPPTSIVDFAFRQERPVVFVTLEEGLGTYTMNKSEWRRLGLERQKSAFAKLLYWGVMVLGTPADRMIWRTVESDCSQLRFTIFDRDESGLIPDPVARRYMALSYEQIAANKGVPHIDYSNAAIVATTKFDVFHAEETELAILEETVGLLKRLGYRVILRPHPGTPDVSRYEALEVEIDEHRHLSLESLIASSSHKPEVMVGFMSSSQVFSNLLWDVPCVSIYSPYRDVFVQEAKTTTPLLQFIRETDRTTKLFPEYVHSPASVEELEECLMELRICSISGNG